MVKKFSLDKNKINILLLEGIHQSAVNAFNEAGYTNIEYLKTALDVADLEQKIKDVHLLGIRSRTQITSDIVKKARKLFAIGCFSIGTNQVDLNAAKLSGIPVFNAPFSNTRSVAELVIAEIIMLMREVPAKNAAAHADDTSNDGKADAPAATHDETGRIEFYRELQIVMEPISGTIRVASQSYNAKAQNASCLQALPTFWKRRKSIRSYAI